MASEPVPAPAAAPSSCALALRLSRAAVPAALLLGLAAGATCWARLGPRQAGPMDVVVREAARTPARVVLRVEITLDYRGENLTIQPSSDAVRWDPEEVATVQGRRRISGNATVGAGAEDARVRAGLWVLLNGHRTRWIELRP